MQTNLATVTGRISSAALVQSNTPKPLNIELPANAPFIPCITWMNMSGDITIAWDETNREKMLEIIRAKMSEGYNFFTVKKVPLIGIERKVRVSKKNIEGLQMLVIPDKEFEKLVAGMNDKDVATLFHKGEVELAKRTDDPASRKMLKRLEKPEDVVKEQAVAFRRVVGG